MLKVLKRMSVITLAATAAATGLMLSGGPSALAATNPSSFAEGPAFSHFGCNVLLLSSRLSSSTPASVAVQVDSLNPGHECTAFMERSLRSTTKWTVASGKVGVPSVAGLESFANSGLIGDGPTYKVRACVQASGSSAVYCGTPLEMPAGSGTATSPALPASFIRKYGFVPGTSSSNACLGYLTSSTTTKKTGALAGSLLISAGDPCTAWFQTTTNGGKTWTNEGSTVSFQGAGSTAFALAFTPRYADNPGTLTRLCVKDTTVNKLNCSGGW